jgi:hypothetical protein
MEHIVKAGRSILHRQSTKLSLSLTKHHPVRVYGREEVYLHVFLTSALDGGE